MTTLLTLPPHLLEAIADILSADLNLEVSADLRAQLSSAVKEGEVEDEDESSDEIEIENYDATGNVDGQAQGQGHKESTDAVPPRGDGVSATDMRVGRRPRRKTKTIDLDVIERLSTWATGAGASHLQNKGIDPNRYLFVSLLAGTEVYLSPSEVARIRAAENPERHDPFLPSYLSAPPPTLGAETRLVTKQLTTILNILFSIFGSAAAVYVASVSGAGYSRETAILLAVLTGVVVGVADGVLVWIFVDRLHRERKEGRRVGRVMGRGSGAVRDEKGEVVRVREGLGERKDLLLESIPPPSDADAIEAEIAEEKKEYLESQGADMGTGAGDSTATEKKTTTIRLRRRAL